MAFKFNGMTYKIGHKGMVFRLRSRGDVTVADDWLRSTVTKDDIFKALHVNKVKV